MTQNNSLKTVCLDCKRFDDNKSVKYSCFIKGKCPAIDMSKETRKAILSKTFKI